MLHINRYKIDTEKSKKKSIPLVIKRKVWHVYIGKEKGTAICPCCEITEIEQLNFSCGHIQSEYNGGQIEVANLIPICASCNSSMGTMNYDVFRSRYNLFHPSPSTTVPLTSNSDGLNSGIVLPEILPSPIIPNTPDLELEPIQQPINPFMKWKCPD
jgi:hypothetical protein